LSATPARAAKVVARHRRLTYLQDGGTTIAGLNFWGTPWQPWFFSWALNLSRGDEIRAKWDLIPEGTDVLVVHGPPAGQLDRNADGDDCGCQNLADAVKRVGPRLVVFGHIHEGYGEAQLTASDGRSIHLVNASICDSDYRPVNSPVVVSLQERAS